MPAHARIKAKRLELGLSLEQVATRLYPWWPWADRSFVSKVERGARKIKADELPRWAAALECRVEDLVDPIE